MCRLYLKLISYTILTSLSLFTLFYGTIFACYLAQSQEYTLRQPSLDPQFLPTQPNEFITVFLKSHDGLTYQAMHTKKWDTGKPTLLFYHGFPESPDTWVE